MCLGSPKSEDLSNGCQGFGKQNEQDKQLKQDKQFKQDEQDKQDKQDKQDRQNKHDKQDKQDKLDKQNKQDKLDKQDKHELKIGQIPPPLPLKSGPNPSSSSFFFCPKIC